MISIIVATAKNGVIGNKNGLPWKLPAELAYFKQITMGHPIIMGRKTNESIGRALPGRTNIVISRNRSYTAPGCKIVASLDAAINLARQSQGAGEIFIIGGESIYNLALPLANRIYHTKVEADIAGDRYFKFDQTKWRQTAAQRHKADASNIYDYTFTTLEKIVL